MSENQDLNNSLENQTQSENMTMTINENESNLPSKDDVQQVVPETSQSLDLTKSITTNLGLLINLKRVVDVCVQRGAFKSEELSQIGQVVDALNLVIKENIE